MRGWQHGTKIRPAGRQRADWRLFWGYIQFIFSISSTNKSYSSTLKKQSSQSCPGVTNNQYCWSFRLFNLGLGLRSLHVQTHTCALVCVHIQTPVEKCLMTPARRDPSAARCRRRGSMVAHRATWGPPHFLCHGRSIGRLPESTAHFSQETIGGRKSLARFSDNCELLHFQSAIVWRQRSPIHILQQQRFIDNSFIQTLCCPRPLIFFFCVHDLSFNGFHFSPSPPPAPLHTLSPVNISVSLSLLPAPNSRLSGRFIDIFPTSLLLPYAHVNVRRLIRCAGGLEFHSGSLPTLLLFLWVIHPSFLCPESQPPTPSPSQKKTLRSYLGDPVTLQALHRPAGGEKESTAPLGRQQQGWGVCACEAECLCECSTIKVVYLLPDCLNTCDNIQWACSKLEHPRDSAGAAHCGWKVIPLLLTMCLYIHTGGHAEKKEIKIKR